MVWSCDLGHVTGSWPIVLGQQNRQADNCEPPCDPFPRLSSSGWGTRLWICLYPPLDVVADISAAVLLAPT